MPQLPKPQPSSSRTPSRVNTARPPPNAPRRRPGQGSIFVGPDNHVIHEAHEVPYWVKLSPFIAMLIGLFGAWMGYIRNPSLPGQWANNLGPLYRLLHGKWYVDDLYELIFTRPAKAIGRFLWKRGDGSVIDGSIDGLAMGIVPFGTRWLNRAQSGYIFTYAAAMVAGIVVLVTWTTLAAGN